MDNDNSQCTSEVNRQALNQVSGWVESTQIKELEAELALLKSLIILDWTRNEEVDFHIRFKPVMNEEAYENLTYVGSYSHRLYRIIMSVHCNKVEAKSHVTYDDMNDELHICLHGGYAFITISNEDNNRHNNFIMMRKRGEDLIKYIDERRNDYAKRRPDNL